MFERIFKYHYSKKYAYAIDVIALVLAMELLLFLNGAGQLSVPQWTKSFCGIGWDANLFRIPHVIALPTFIDIGKLPGLLLALTIYAIFIQADTRALQLFVAAFILAFFFIVIVCGQASMPVLSKINSSIHCFWGGGQWTSNQTGFRR